MKIIVEFINPPIPIRNYDWQATRWDYDEGNLIGNGETKELAIANLLIQEFESNQ